MERRKTDLLRRAKSERMAVSWELDGFLEDVTPR